MVCSRTSKTIANNRHNPEFEEVAESVKSPAGVCSTHLVTSIFALVPGQVD
jgi:hypothetical protein